MPGGPTEGATSRESDRASERLLALRALPDSPDSLPQIVAATKDPSINIARTALRRLAKLGGDRDAAELRSRMLDVDPALTKDFAATLAALGDEQAADESVEALSNESPHRRIAAAAVLEVLASPEQGTALADALGDSLAAIRSSALAALRRIGAREYGSACVALLDDSDPQVRVAAVGAVAALVEEPGPLLDGVNRADAPEVRVAVAAHLPVLDQTVARVLLTDDEPAVREAAARAAGADRAGLRALILEGDPVIDVRITAARRLGDLVQVDDLDSISGPLVKGLTDRSPMVRVAALESLGKVLGRKGAVTRLIEAMTSEEEEQRRAAIYALARLRASESEEALAAALDDRDREVRLAAVHCAEQLFGPDWEPLSRVAEDPDPAVNHAVRMIVDRAGRQTPS